MRRGRSSSTTCSARTTCGSTDIEIVARVANLRRDPRASLIIHDQVDYLHYVSIRGTATVLDEGDAAVAEAMSQAERYGEDPTEFAGQPRVSFRINLERLAEYS